MYKLAIVIPIFNHAEQFKAFLPKLLMLDTPIIVVDDGSFEVSEIEKIATENNLIFTKNEKNQGKGAAFCKGAKLAQELGFTHIFQIDADGQHDINYFKNFKSLSMQNPSAIINSCPIYNNAPASRFYGRKITNFWVAIEAPMAKISDAMCGFRIYPISEVLKVIPHLKFMRMGFDIEIIVRMAWIKCEILNLEVAVNYPENGTSNFRLIKDNLSISALHTLLCTEGILNYLRKVFQWKHQ